VKFRLWKERKIRFQQREARTEVWSELNHDEGSLTREDEGEEVKDLIYQVEETE